MSARTTVKSDLIDACEAALSVVVALLLTLCAARAEEKKDPPVVRFVRAGEEPDERVTEHRRLIVGPEVNQPRAYEGYEGFVGWGSIAPLRSGRWLHVFNSGYWHASPPQSEEILKKTKADERGRSRLEGYRAAGFPPVVAPRGGRAHIMHSDDRGKTWSAPRVLIDTPGDDRHPTLLELDDGTLLCNFFNFFLIPGEGANIHMRSRDGGKTWIDRKDLRGPLPAAGGKWTAAPDRPRDDTAPRVGRTDGPVIQLVDGSVLWVGGAGQREGSDRFGAAVYRSTNRGRSFELVNVVTADHRLDEPAIAELPGGKLIMLFRPRADISWSDDRGHTWSAPVPMIPGAINLLFDPHLLLLPNGVLACFHGSYTKGGLRVLLSPNHGHTWHGPGTNYGYFIDGVYGYSHAMLLPDGSVYLVYQDTGGHNDDRKTARIFGLRLRVKDAADGIELLPPPD